MDNVRRLDPVAPDAEIIAKAARIIKRGGTVAFPTETVYGLGANALDDQACKQIFVAKGRQQDNPIIVHVSDFEQIENITYGLPAKTKEVF